MKKNVCVLLCKKHNSHKKSKNMSKDDEVGKLDALDAKEEAAFEADQDGEAVDFVHHSPVVEDGPDEDANDLGDYALPQHAEGEWPDGS